MFWGAMLLLPYDPVCDAFSWRWNLNLKIFLINNYSLSGGGGEERCEAGDQPAGVERGGYRQGSVSLPLQHRPLPGWQTHHICSGIFCHMNFAMAESVIRAMVWSCLLRLGAQRMQWPLVQAWSTPVYLPSWSLPSVHIRSHSGGTLIMPCMPISSPHTSHGLCRPIVVPAGVELKISVSPDSRNTAWVSFDGRKRQELCHGDSLRVTTSIYPIPSICAQVSLIPRLNCHWFWLQYLFPGPNHGLVRFPGWVLTLECEEKATNPRRAERLVERSLCCLG